MNLLKELIGSLLKILWCYLLIKRTGFLLGIPLIILIINTYKYLVKRFLNIEYLSATDKVFLGTKNNERNNCFIHLKIDQVSSVESLKNAIIERGITRNKYLRQRIKYVLFDYFWIEESLEIAKSRIKVYSGSYSEEQVYDFLQQRINEHFDLLKEIPYFFHIFKSTNENEAFVTLQIDHVRTDGLGMISLLYTMADDYKIDMLPLVMRKHQLNWKLTFFSLLYLPFNLWVVFKDIFFTKLAPTPYKIKNRSEGTSTFAHSSKFKFSKVKQINKKLLKCSFNDLIVSVCSSAMKEYSIKYKDMSPTNFLYTIPIGFKNIPHSVEEAEIKNDANGLMIKYPAISDIETQIKDITKQSNQFLRDMTKLKVIVWFGDFLCEFFPISVIHKILHEGCKSNDSTISNVGGYEGAIIVDGARMVNGFPIPSTGVLGLFITIYTYNDNLNITVSSDKSIDVDPSILIEMIENKIDNLLAKVQ